MLEILTKVASGEIKQDEAARLIAALSVADDWATSTEPDEAEPTTNAAYEKLIEYMDEHGIGYQMDGERHRIWTDFRCAVGTYRVMTAVDDEGCLFQVVGYSRLRVPEGARPSIAETIARANYSLLVGKFEMDFDEGELRFQAAQILTDDSLEEDVIDRLMGTTMSMLDIYLPAVLSVIYGNELPKDAVRCAEAGFRASDQPQCDEGGADE